MKLLALIPLLFAWIFWERDNSQLNNSKTPPLVGRSVPEHRRLVGADVLGRPQLDNSITRILDNSITRKLDNCWSLSRENGKATFLSAQVSQSIDEVQSSVRAAYRAAGWNEAPVHPADTLIFTSGTRVAAILTEWVDNQTRITAIQRR